MVVPHHTAEPINHLPVRVAKKAIRIISDDTFGAFTESPLKKYLSGCHHRGAARIICHAKVSGDRVHAEFDASVRRSGNDLTIKFSHMEIINR